MYFLAISFSSNLRHLFKNRPIESKTAVLSEILQPSLSRKNWKIRMECWYRVSVISRWSRKNKQWSV